MVGRAERSATDYRHAQCLKKIAGNDVVVNRGRRLALGRRIALRLHLHWKRKRANRPAYRETGRFPLGERANTPQKIAVEMPSLGLAVADMARVKAEIHAAAVLQTTRK